MVAIIPIVIDLLNLEKSFDHHWRAYGFWAPAIQDYIDANTMNWMDSSEFKALMKIEDPYEYRDRLTMPKYIVNATGDQFFLPDSSQFYFDDLKGEKYLRYVPNSEHSMRGTDAFDNVHAYYKSFLSESERPKITWKFEKDGSIRVKASGTPSAVKLWQATNPKTRDFRVDTIGRSWKETDLTPVTKRRMDRQGCEARNRLDRLLRRIDVPFRREAIEVHDCGCRHTGHPTFSSVPAKEALTSASRSKFVLECSFSAEVDLP